MSTKPPTTGPEEFGERLARVRRLRGIATQGSAAELAGVNKNTYGSWEKGYVYPEALALMKLAAAFGVTVDWLLTGSTAGLPLETWRLVSEDAPSPPRGRGRPPRLGTARTAA